MAVLSSVIEKLCTTGCNVTVNYPDYLQSQIENFVSLTVKANGHITIKNCTKALTSSLEKLASLGKDHITIDFTE